jgi:hypothetical protein
MNGLLERVSDFDNRYSFVRYGKFHLQTEAVEVLSFSVTDLFFYANSDVDEILSDFRGTYVFSKILHKKIGELELGVVSCNTKDTYSKSGWITDV